MKLGVLKFELRLVGLDFQILDLIHHAVEGGAQLLQLLDLLVLPKAHGHLPGADAQQVAVHLLHRAQVPALEHQKQQRHERRDEQREREDNEDQPVDFFQADRRGLKEHHVDAADRRVTLHDKAVAGKIRAVLSGPEHDAVFTESGCGGQRRSAFVCEEEPRILCERGGGLRAQDLIEIDKADGAGGLRAEIAHQKIPPGELHGPPAPRAVFSPALRKAVDIAAHGKALLVGGVGRCKGAPYYVVGTGDEKNGGDGRLHIHQRAVGVQHIESVLVSVQRALCVEQALVAVFLRPVVRDGGGNAAHVAVHLLLIEIDDASPVFLLLRAQLLKGEQALRELQGENGN